MFNGVPGTKTERLYFNFINAAANKVRDCYDMVAIRSIYEQELGVYQPEKQKTTVRD